MHVISRFERPLGRHSREHLRLGPKLAPRFLGRQQAAAQEFQPCSLFAADIRKPATAEGVNQAMSKVAKNETAGAVARSSINFALRGSKAAKDRLKIAQAADSPP
jgi:hypothetical protein